MASFQGEFAILGLSKWPECRGDDISGVHTTANQTSPYLLGAADLVFAADSELAATSVHVCWHYGPWLLPQFLSPGEPQLQEQQAPAGWSSPVSQRSHLAPQGEAAAGGSWGRLNG